MLRWLGSAVTFTERADVSSVSLVRGTGWAMTGVGEGMWCGRPRGGRGEGDGVCVIL